MKRPETREEVADHLQALADAVRNKETILWRSQNKELELNIVELPGDHLPKLRHSIFEYYPKPKPLAWWLVVDCRDSWKGRYDLDSKEKAEKLVCRNLGDRLLYIAEQEPPSDP